jgi:hypothetical protein
LEAEHQRWRDALEVEHWRQNIGGGVSEVEGIGGAQRWMELTVLTENTKCWRQSKQSELVRTCQNLSGQDGTCLGLLLLHVGPNGDGFGGQAFMEHYNELTEDKHTYLFPTGSLLNLIVLSLNKVQTQSLTVATIPKIKALSKSISVLSDSLPPSVLNATKNNKIYIVITMQKDGIICRVTKMGWKSPKWIKRARITFNQRQSHVRHRVQLGLTYKIYHI